MLGGGGLIAANVYASAAEGWGQEASGDGPVPTAGAATIDCPDVGTRLTSVPDGARGEVDRELALLDEQIAAAYRQFQETPQAERQDPGFTGGALMDPLKEKRAATIGRITDAIDQEGDRPQGLDELAECSLRPADGPSGDGTDGGGGQDGAAQEQNGGGQDQSGGGPAQGSGQGGNGPVASDYQDITTVQPGAQSPPRTADASRGSFTSSCGVNAGGLFNSDNVIVAPGVSNGAHHFHDYIGNQANSAFASDEDLAGADTSCVDKGDKSSYYWPVLRLQNGTRERDADAPGGGTEGNAGQIVTPRQVTLTFVGNPREKVTAMPRLLRIITGDAKAFVNGPANANASWSCTGFEDRQVKDKYPLCPAGSDVVRTFAFQGCWDGRNIDSANHRTHVAFAGADGGCPAGFRAIPQLVQRIVYDVDAPSLADGGRAVPLFAVDSFPEQLHKPVTDHGDFINVFDEDLMGEMVDCINTGGTCGADAAPAPSEEPSEPPASSAAPTAGTGAEPEPGGTTGEQSAEPPADAPATEPADTGAPAVSGTTAPRVYASASPGRTASAAAPGGADAEDGTPTTGPAPAGTAVAAEAGDASATGGTEPQAVEGGLADTGARLWPAALGAALVIAGFVVLRRTGRRA
ncbi:DUF1996 domain-containing protein [Streptomyces shenzhenensis]|uniref:DUF1996 domain-containing protein n=1 Tax=Streptomyces shenzhenensis TaxID=943815 RepID=A0A3M0ICD0_9ACTN|nr:DUF1996 domain-containing protein [Streptomyces shenzhenensis]RMB86112.1 hypothetical protein CTZ28_11525 [Streptomyces shenzhenensis]